MMRRRPNRVSERCISVGATQLLVRTRAERAEPHSTVYVKDLTYRSSTYERDHRCVNDRALIQRSTQGRAMLCAYEQALPICSGKRARRHDRERLVTCAAMVIGGVALTTGVRRNRCAPYVREVPKERSTTLDFSQLSRRLRCSDLRNGRTDASARMDMANARVPALREGLKCS